MGAGMLLGQETKVINRIDMQTLQSAYKNGVLANAKDINTGNYRADVNRPHLVNSNSTNIPSKLSWGIREIFFYDNKNVIIQITGVDTDNNIKIWHCAGTTTSNSTFTIGTWVTMEPPILTAGTDNELGLTKLYDTVGDNSDGTMTQTAIKMALGKKAESSHKHTVSEITDFPKSLPASDVSDWAKAETKPTYTKSDVGLGNVGNFKAVSTVASQGLTDAEKENARANIGAGTSSFSGSYNDLSNKPGIGNGKVTIKQGGVEKGSFTMNQSGATVVELNDLDTVDVSRLRGTISIDNLPQGALDRMVKVATDTERFKLTTDDIQLGDTVKVTGTTKMYYVVDESNLDNEKGYEPYTADSATSVPWSGVTNKPNTYPPSTHSHTKSDVGLGNVDNTADADKSVKYATSAGTATNATNASKVNGHTVNADVPSNAKFTDTNTWTANTVNTDGYVDAGEGYPNKVWKTNEYGIPAWRNDDNTTYEDATISLSGLMSKADKKKLDGIDEGANKYSHPTTSGNKHIPSGGSKGQILRWNADGTAIWGNENDTTYSNFVKSGSGAKAGLVPAPPSTAGSSKYLREDGTWTIPPDNNTTYEDMVAATANAAGKAGLVPAPAAGAQAKFLRGDGTWAIPTNTTYNNFVKSGSGAKAGLVPAPPTTAGTTKYLREDGTWVVPPDTNITYEVATQTANGLMSSADKKKLDGIAEGNKFNATYLEDSETIVFNVTSGSVVGETIILS